MSTKFSFGRGRILFVFCSLALLVPIATGTLTRAATKSAAGEDSIFKQLSVFSEVLSLIRRYYVEPTSVDGLFRGAFEGAVDALDPLATYVPESAVESYRKAREIGSAHSGLELARQRGFTYVVSVEPGSPGAQAELEGGDILTEIDGRSTREMGLWEIETVLAAEVGAKVELKYLRRGQPAEVELVLNRFGRHGPQLEIRDGIAVVTIRRFASEVPEELTKLLDRVPADRPLLIDVRGAAAGSSDGAYQTAALFVSGLLGQLRTRDEVVEEFRSGTEPVWSGRIMVLTDRSSQGASEIFAAVVRHGAGAEHVGQRTFGHAARRATASLSNGAEIHFTDAFYSGPDGEPIDQSLMPEWVIGENLRRLSEADLPFDELVLRRAIERLREAPEPEKKAA